MKYKVGDKARVRTDLTEDERYGGVTVADEMVDMRGMTVTIEDVDESGYGIKEDPEGYTWTDEMFEPVEEELTAEEAIRLKGEMCTGKLCNNCKLSSKNNGMGIACNELEKKHPERAIEILKQYEEILNPGDWLVDRGWVLLHNPSQGVAFATGSLVRDMTKAQKEFLYDYYIERVLHMLKDGLE